MQERTPRREQGTAALHAFTSRRGFLPPVSSPFSCNKIYTQHGALSCSPATTMNVLPIIPGTPTAQLRPCPDAHLGPGPLQGPLQFAQEQHSTGAPRKALAGRACRERGCPGGRGVSAVPPDSYGPAQDPAPSCPSEGTSPSHPPASPLPCSYHLGHLGCGARS